MNTLRWLMKHPIVLAWLLALLAILLNFGVGGKGGEEHAAKEGAKKAAHHAAFQKVQEMTKDEPTIQDLPGLSLLGM